MHLTKKETTKKLLVFYRRPANQTLLLNEGNYNKDLWVQIFIHFFNCEPRSVDGTSERMVRGGTDPRWDTLFYEMKSLEANAFILKLFERREKYAHNLTTRRKAT